MIPMIHFVQSARRANLDRTTGSRPHSSVSRRASWLTSRRSAAPLRRWRRDFEWARPAAL